MNNKEIILNNIIGLNPTGIIDFDGTFKMKGSNNIVMHSNKAIKENLKKSQTNAIICNNQENFENINSNKKSNYKKNIIFFLILI